MHSLWNSTYTGPSRLIADLISTPVWDKIEEQITEETYLWVQNSIENILYDFVAISLKYSVFDKVRTSVDILNEQHYN